MPKQSNTLKGYVKTSNVYLSILMALSVGFLGGVIVSSYKSATFFSPMPANRPAPAPSARTPLTPKQSERLAALMEATQATPDNVQAWTQLGDLYFDTGRYPNAIEAYEKSLSLDGQRPDVWTDLGVMYRRSKKPKKALESFDRALSINTRHEIAMFNKGVVFKHDLNDNLAALNAWEQLVLINPKAKAPSGIPVSDLIAELKKKGPS